MDLDALFHPVEQADEALVGLLEGAPLVMALALAAVLGLRHATDPDHLVAVTELVAVDGGDVRRARRLGAWWGVGHATALLVVGLPLIALRGELPDSLETTAERLVGVVIVVLAVRVLLACGPLDRWRSRPAQRRPPRGAARAAAIGVLHGLAGTGAVVLLLLAALPDRGEAAAALALFAPMSVLSMAACTTAWAWALTRGPAARVLRAVLLPLLGAFGVVFGLWYAGVT